MAAIGEMVQHKIEICHFDEECQQPNKINEESCFRDVDMNL